MGTRVNKLTGFKQKTNHDLEKLFGQFDEKFKQCKNKIAQIKKDIDDYRSKTGGNETLADETDDGKDDAPQNQYK